MSQYKITGVKSMNLFIFYLLNFIMLWTITIATILVRAPLAITIILGFICCTNFVGFIFNFITIKAEVG